MLKIAYDKIYAHPLPKGHRFPMEKYELIPQQLIHEGIISEANLFSPSILDEDTILLTHSMDYWDRMKNLALTTKEMRAIGFPLSAELIERERRICQGTIDCTQYAIKYGVSLNIAGGTHHSFADRGEGFCLLNDFAIAANYLINNRLAKQILIVDLDVHQGNGSAAIFKHESKVFTFSMHGAHNYPFRKEESDLDIGLPDGVNGENYLAILAQELPKLIKQVQPEHIFYLSGVDILSTDKFGKLNITIDECKQRDEMVFHLCKDYSIPVTVAMGGGYSPQVKDIVNAHCNTYKAAKDIFEL
ncbi:MAG: histone deacetylase [Flavipsychrobacter sp.]